MRSSQGTSHLNKRPTILKSAVARGHNSGAATMRDKNIMIEFTDQAHPLRKPSHQKIMTEEEKE